MRRLALVFIITFAITFIAQAAYDWMRSAIAKYIKTQIRQAKLINIVTKYNIKPEGLEG
jgi:uncharacterized membrane protein